ncbi:MAG: 3-hydroxyacyl-CoA dehydrogenase NAD-binding domain-containing protein [Vicinamibacteria bacterium]
MIGLHFLQPVPSPHVEVVRGLSTSNETFHAAMEFVQLSLQDRHRGVRVPGLRDDPGRSCRSSTRRCTS